MNDDELDRSTERLFQAGRSDRPSQEARARALTAALGSARGEERSPGWPRWTWAAPALCAAAALALWAATTSQAHHPAIVAERLPSSVGLNPSADLPRVTPETVTPPRSSAPASPASAPIAPSVRREPAPTLGDEIALLESARAALASGDGNEALALLERHRRRVRAPKLGDEATILRLEALSRTGRAADAERLARQFIAKHATSPLADRARAFIAESTGEPERKEGEKP